MGVANISRLPRSKRFHFYCDFCGGLQGEVTTLISSDNGKHICDECVDVCAEIVAKKREAKERDDD